MEIRNVFVCNSAGNVVCLVLFLKRNIPLLLHLSFREGKDRHVLQSNGHLPPQFSHQVERG